SLQLQVRLARSYTRRNKIAKFEGGWHGGYDALHIGVKPPFDVPESAGLTAGALQDTIVLPFNDLEGVKKKLAGEDVASITVEPVLGAGGCIPAEKEFLKGLRELCNKRDILLIFDEVITGFRMAPGGAQEYYGVLPDLAVFGKILGGGFPIGAFCGSREVMARINTRLYERPEHSFHGGTFAANPISMTAGLATLKQLEDGRLLSELNKQGEVARKKLKECFEDGKIDVQVTGDSSLFNIHFTRRKIRNANDSVKTDKNMLFDYNLNLIVNGVFFLPGHNGALSTAHSKEDMEKLYHETEAYVTRLKEG
ncbi:aminotransferase class III-fold pyridoxal phosphate-dependent enzyme, partial [Candidatus Bathyarchaeota archaeon]|nr:aminotransferase class III-fold pyridoxal phosphate-dependent enzyme [Candidatus Bathyarchaeota archaeon]